MQTKGLRLYKAEKLCSETAINLLFERVTVADRPKPRKAICYPLRAVWTVNPVDAGGPAKFLIMIPKRRLRHAVDRVTMRRRVREAYRLNRNLLPDGAPGLNIAFIYVADTLKPYAHIERAMRRLLNDVAVKDGLKVQDSAG